MTRKPHPTIWAPLMAVLMVAPAVGCSQVSEPGAVQRAVGSGAQGALGSRPGASAPSEASDPQRAQPSTAESVPTGTLVGSGVSARLEFVPDREHSNIVSSALAPQVGVSWTDAESNGIFFGRVNREGRPEGTGLRLHEAVGDEEAISAPSVAAMPGGYGVAWVDRENGRVRFRRVDAQGRAVGPAAIVHEGLESPERVQLVWNGREFALAVTLWQGVYFARLSSDGQRQGDGAVLGEGDAVQTPAELRWDGRSWDLSWVSEHDGRVQRSQQRFGPRGERQGTASVFVVDARPSA